MSLQLRTHINRFKTKAAVVLGVSGMLVTASMLAPASGAYFFDAKQGHAISSTANFGLSVENGNEAFDFGFDDLTPGTSHTENFTVKNIGTVAGYFRFYTDGMQVAGGVNPNVGLLHYEVNGEDATPHGAQQAWLDFGPLQPGQERTFTIKASLDASAGSEWANTTVTTTVGLTLSQIF